MSCFELIIIAGLIVASVCAGHVEPAEPPLFHLPNASPTADFDRLPVFYTSDPEYDSFVNEWFIRHFSVDRQRALHDYGSGVVLGATDHLWCVEWDAWYLSWIDRGAMGTERQGGNDVDWQYYYLLNTPVNKYGQMWGAIFSPEPKDRTQHWKPLIGWPWPKFDRDYTTPIPHGWNFNDLGDGMRDRWLAMDIKLSPGYVDHSLEGTITGPRPELISPKFDADVFQVPLIELDIEYRWPESMSHVRPLDIVGGLKIYWKTNDSPRWTEDKSVTVDFADLPPAQFPREYVPFATPMSARFPLYFLMCNHPKWGREGRRITRLKIVPTGPGMEGVTVSLNYVRASYDVRLYTTNGIVINSAFRYFMWSGDREFLQAIMPRLRKCMIYMNEHLGGRKHGLIWSGWMVGKEGIGGGEVGRSVYGSYWDLLPSGVYDIESSVHYYSALKAMAELERVVRRYRIPVPDVSVLGPDDRTTLVYSETPESLEKQAQRVKANIEKVFWVKETGRFCKGIDVHGKQHDYGFVHFNVWAMAQGIGTQAQRDSVLSWLDGSRSVAGDTSIGKDIYHWRFGPRTSTKQNTDWLYWAWIHDGANAPPEWKYAHVWGNQFQDGGAAPFTGMFDLMLRTSTGRQEDIDAAFERTREIQSWFSEVKATGGDGKEFYRKYYEGHPERGIMQSPMPGGLGLDREFLSDGSLETAFIPLAFLGLKSEQDGILDIVPAVPRKLSKVGVRNVFYRGNHLTIEAGRYYVSLAGSRMPKSEGLRVRIIFRNAPRNPRVSVNGAPYPFERIGSSRDIIVTTELKPVLVQVTGSSDQ